LPQKQQKGPEVENPLRGLSLAFLAKSIDIYIFIDNLKALCNDPVSRFFGREENR
jgi:hypothetical protein